MKRNRSGVIDYLFGCVLLIAFIALIYLFCHKDGPIFLRWMTFIGLALDAVGASMLALSEIRWIHKHIWMEMISAKNKLLDRETLEPDDSGFEGMVEILKDRRSITWGEEKETDVTISNFAFYNSHDDDVFARIDGRQVYFGTTNQIETWTFEKIADWTRAKVTPYGLSLLLIGFILQLLSYGVLNL